MGAGCQFRMSNHNLTSNSFAPSHPPPPKLITCLFFFFYKKSAFPGSILFYLMKVSRYLIHKTVLLMQERKTEKPITKTIVLSAFPPIPQILSRGQTKRPKVKKNFGVVSHPVHVTYPTQSLNGFLFTSKYFCYEFQCNQNSK